LKIGYVRLGQNSSSIYNGTVSGSVFTFTDQGGNYWSYSFTTDLIQGAVSIGTPGCSNLKSAKVLLSRKG
jgi:hypothetical protein